MGIRAEVGSPVHTWRSFILCGCDIRQGGNMGYSVVSDNTRINNHLRRHLTARSPGVQRGRPAARRSPTPRTERSLLFQSRNCEVVADTCSGQVGDLGMARHGSASAAVRVDRVLALAHEHAAVLLQVANQVAPLHTSTVIGSRAIMCAS